MQHACRICTQAAHIGHYARRNRVSLNSAIVSWSSAHARHTSSSSGTPNTTNVNAGTAGAKVEGAPAPSGSWIQQANTDFVVQLEKILSARPKQKVSGYSDPPARKPTSSRPPPSTRHPPSVRHVRLRALSADKSGIAEALALSISGDGEQTRPPPTRPLALPPLPEVPEAPRSVLTAQQAQVYLTPLYSRGWHMSSARDIRDPAQHGLTKITEFKTRKLAQEFMVQLLKTCHKDAFDTKYTVRRRENSVLFTTHSPETPKDSHRITLADVVAAFTVERLWELQGCLGSLARVGAELQAQHGHGLHPLNISTVAEPFTETSTTQEGSRAQKRRTKRIRCGRCGGKHHVHNCTKERIPPTCLACSGLHHVNACPQRAEFKPTKACPTCGSDDHWAVDCPGKNPNTPVAKDGRQQPKDRKCFVCGGRDHFAKDCMHRAEHPPSQGCLLCQKHGHWVYDCPELPNRPEFVIRDCSYCGGMHWVAMCRHLQRDRGVQQKRDTQEPVRELSGTASPRS